MRPMSVSKTKIVACEGCGHLFNGFNYAMTNPAKSYCSECGKKKVWRHNWGKKPTI